MISGGHPRHEVIATMARHHYVPQFLLRGWATNGKLYAYHWNDGAKRVIENDKASVASACQIRDLNVFFGVSKATCVTAATTRAADTFWSEEVNGTKTG